MDITVRAFAAYREAIGASRVSLEVAAQTTAAGAWDALRRRYPALDRLPRPVAFAVNDTYVASDTVLRERDELVLIPPVSGGAGAPAGGAGPADAAPAGAGDDAVALVDGPIDVGGLLERVRHPQAGAVVLFLGTVRDNRSGRRVHHLEYEAYETMARREMARVAAEASERWPILRIAISHRLGRLRVGDVSVAIAVAAAHRREAFEAGRYAIDALKQTVPIWKKEVWEGGEAWVGAEPSG